MKPLIFADESRFADDKSLSENSLGKHGARMLREPARWKRATSGSAGILPAGSGGIPAARPKFSDRLQIAQPERRSPDRLVTARLGDEPIR